MSTTRARLLVVAFTVVTMLAVIPGTAWAQLTVTDDTYVSGATPTTANGSSTSLVVQGSTTVPQKPSHSYVRFDLTSLGGVSSTQIQRATLRLYVTAVSAAGNFDVIEVTSPTGWAESTLTYNTTGAGTPTGTVRASNVPVLYPGGKSQYILLDVTPAVVDWLNGATNNGFALVPSNGYASPISVTFSSKEDTTYSHEPTLIVVVKPGFGSSSGVQSFNGRTGVVTSQSNDYTFGMIAGGLNNNGLLVGGTLAPSGGTITANALSSGTYNISISGNAATATTATTATNANQLGGVAAANYARVDVANTFTGANILGNSSAGSGGLLIPPSGTGANKNSFLFNLQSTGASATNTFGFQASTTPSLNLMFCNSSGTCAPTATGLSIASNGIITFAAGQTFPGTGNGTVTNFSSGNLSPLFTTSVANPTTTPALSFTLNTQGANTVFAGPTSGTAAPAFRSLVAADIPSIAESQVTGLTTDLASKANAASITGATNTKITYNYQGIVTAGAQAQFSDLGGSVATGQLPSTVVYNDQANTYTAGKKQKFQTDATDAGLAFSGVTADPGTLANGDVWYRSDLKHVQVFAGTTTHEVAFTDDVISNSQVSGTYSNPVTFNNASNSFSGTFSGNGSALTSLSGGNITAGSVPNSALSNSSVTVAAGTGLAGGGTVALGGTVMLSNAGVLSVSAGDGTIVSTGGQTPSLTVGTISNSNITDNTISAAKITNTAAVLAGGNVFTGGLQKLAPSAGSYASLNVPSSATPPGSPNSGDVWLDNADIHLQFRDNAGSPLTHMLAFTDDVISNSQVSGTYSNAVTFSNASNSFSGTFSGNGSALTSLSGGNITAGSVPNSALSNSSVTVAAGTGLAGGGTVALGGTVMLSNAGVLSVSAGDGTIVSTGGQTPSLTVGTISTSNITDNTISAAKITNTAAVLAGGNVFTGGLQKLAPSAGSYASLNVPSSATPPGSPNSGDVWLENGDIHLQFRDNAGSPLTHSLMFTDDT